MANIFRKKDAYIDRVNRSTFDLSFVNNLTMKFGAITPVCLLPASFGDSFQINARFNLQLLPTVFPIQTQLYVRLHFVYVRTRTLWEDWMAFFGGDETVTPPWMDVLADGDTPERKARFNIPDDLQTGSLADYLGIPTTITGSFGKEERFEPTFCSEPKISGNVMSIVSVTNLTSRQDALSYFSGKINSSVTTVLSCTYSSSENNDKKVFGYRVGALPASSDGKKGTVYVRNLGSVLAGMTQWEKPIVLGARQDGTLLKVIDCEVSQDRQSIYFDLDRTGEHSLVKIIYLAFSPIAYSSYSRAVTLQTVPGSVSTRIVMSSTPIGYASFNSQEWTKPAAANCPFYTSSGMPAIPLSALPFRAYEAYYNAFGRDIRNNPFIVDGKPEYNRYVPSVKVDLMAISISYIMLIGSLMPILLLCNLHRLVSLLLSVLLLLVRLLSVMLLELNIMLSLKLLKTVILLQVFRLRAPTLLLMLSGTLLVWLLLVFLFLISGMSTHFNASLKFVFVSLRVIRIL